MAQAPQVRNLNTLISEIGKSIQPQMKRIDKDIARHEQAGEAQVAGLQATKERTFGQIEQQAQDKGMFFSGFSPDEQATYTSESYLPALANLQSTIAQTRSDMLGRKEGLEQDVFNKAFGARESDRDFLNQWKKMTAEQKFSASQADKDRAFQAEQANIERQFTSSQNARQRANQLADAAMADDRAKEAVNKVGGFLDTRKGKDGRVAPRDFQKGRQMWAAAGGTPDEYAQLFYGFVNTKHEQDYF